MGNLDGRNEPFLAGFVAADASWLVTGDQDLLVIRAELDVHIVAPAEALQINDFCR